MRYTPVLAAALFMAGCFGSKEKSAPTAVTEQGVDVKNNPLGALGALGRAGQDFEKFQKELENMPAVEPLHFSKLVAALPEPPSGWTAKPAKGETNQMGEFKMSRASRDYQKEGGNERVQIQIEDWAFNRAIYAPFMLQAQFSQESTDGYSKGIKAGEDPGREEYKVAQKRGHRSILFRKRYHTKVDIRNLEPAAFDEWWGLIKTSELPATN